MKLNENFLNEKSKWEKANIKLPKYQVDKMKEITYQNPTWLHFGAGNIFRAFLADLDQDLLEEGVSDTGIIVADTFDYDIIDKIYKGYDNLTLQVLLYPDGGLSTKMIASIAESLKGDTASKDFERLSAIFCNPSLQMISFTITEKGYELKNLQGDYLPDVINDIEKEPVKPKHIMSIITCLLYKRYLKGAYPLALLSMDNCSHNGEKLQHSILIVAREWIKRHFIKPEFFEYLTNEKLITFPWTMIDKITPRPSKEVKEKLSNAGVEDIEPIITSRNTYIAPFVNAEVPQYLVIEDKFPNGRPPLEKAGVYMTDRDTVNKTERMKVTTCLNPLHTALAVYGCLLGYHTIADEMKDEELRKLVQKIGLDEGMRVVTNPGILEPFEFIREVIDIRLPNTYIPDTPQRIATDTSQKVAIRFGETIKEYGTRNDLKADELVYIPLAIAGWLRYLLGIDDMGNAMELSKDPMLVQLKEEMKGIVAGQPQSYQNQLKQLLSNQSLFGINLYEVGLADKIEGYFCEMLEGNGAVRSTLKKYLNHKDEVLISG